MSNAPVRLDQLLRDLAAELTQAGIANPRLEARVIAGAASGLALEAMIAHPETELDIDSAGYAHALTECRCKGAPVAYLLGHKEFWSLDFTVTSATLVPRPDSETLVSAALHFADDLLFDGRVLDLGTGSGCLLQAFLSERPLAQGVAVDASIDALAVAALNADTHGLGGRVDFICSDWTQALAGPFDLIFANPPYIPAGDIAGLAVEVRDFEPHTALDGGADGLDCYRAILADLPRVMAPGARVFFEVGAGQAEDVERLAEQVGLISTGIYRDLAGIARCVSAQKNPLE